MVLKLFQFFLNSQKKNLFYTYLYNVVRYLFKFGSTNVDRKVDKAWRRGRNVYFALFLLASVRFKFSFCYTTQVSLLRDQHSHSTKSQATVNPPFLHLKERDGVRLFHCSKCHWQDSVPCLSRDLLAMGHFRRYEKGWAHHVHHPSCAALIGQEYIDPLW